MIATANRWRSAGWLVLLGLCLALVLVLAFRVNALRSQVHHAEARIVALKQEKMYLETEFETRANQQQLKVWNDVEFGYAAPLAGQYLEGERQLAAFSVPTVPNAPAPIRVASVDDAVVASAAFPAMVSPLSGRPLDDNAEKIDAKAERDADRGVPMIEHAVAVETLNERLGKVVDSRPRAPVRTATAADKQKPSSSAAGKVSPKNAATGEQTSSSKTVAGKSKVTANTGKASSSSDKSKAKIDTAAANRRAAKGKEAKAAL